MESTSARDFRDVEAWVKGDDIEPALLQEFSDRNFELHTVTKKARSIYNGIFNLLVRQEARDWITQKALQPDNLDDHHIVPASWGKKNHLKKGTIDTILNRTLLSSETNRTIIRDRLPNEYLPELISSNGEDAVRPVLESHFISLKAQEILLRDTFGLDDYEEFIAERQRTILEAIENLLIKDRLTLSMSMRELDQDIEKVELSLRQVIGTTLDDDVGQLPPHIAQKIDECIRKVAKKNVAIDVENYEALTSRLEFATLPDLKDIITSKITWAYFEPRFVNKETLNKKFSQLAEIRNVIRHSRRVDEITRKEGEAAILWFKDVLKNEIPRRRFE